MRTACGKVEVLEHLGSQRLLGVAGPQLGAHGRAAGMGGSLEAGT